MLSDTTISYSLPWYFCTVPHQAGKRQRIKHTENKMRGSSKMLRLVFIRNLVITMMSAKDYEKLLKFTPSIFSSDIFFDTMFSDVLLAVKCFEQNMTILLTNWLEIKCHSLLPFC